MVETRAERAARLQADPETLNKICVHISNGGDLINLAEGWDVRFGDLANWLHADKERERRYLAAMNDRMEWGQEVILKELRSIGLSDLRSLFKEDGSLKPTNEWPESMGKMVSLIEVDELFAGYGKERSQIGFTKKIKLWDKMRALELLGKNLALFTEKVEHTGTLTLNDLILESMKPKSGV